MATVACRLVSAAVILTTGVLVGCSEDPVASDPFPNPIAHYLMNGDAADISSNGFHGTVHGGEPGTDRFGNSGGAYSFDGLADWIDTEVVFDYPRRTFSIWFYMREQLPRYQRIFAQNGPGLTYGGFAVGVEVDGVLEGCAGGCPETSHGGHPIGDVQIETGRWYHLVLVRDVDTGRYYLDGDLVMTSIANDVASINGSNTLRFAATRLADRFFAGKIDDVRVYDRAFSSAEVAALYAYESTRN
jgi:hypothetical protein